MTVFFSARSVSAAPFTIATIVRTYSGGNEYYGATTWEAVSHKTVLQLNNRSGVTYHYSYRAITFTSLTAYGTALLGYWAQR